MYTDEFGLEDAIVQLQHKIGVLKQELDLMRGALNQTRREFAVSQRDNAEQASLLEKANALIGNLTRIYKWIEEAYDNSDVKSAELDEALRECSLLLAGRLYAEMDQ